MTAAWPQLPSDLAPAMRGDLPALAAEIVEAIVDQVPEYRRPLRGEFAAGIRMGVDQSLRRFVELVENPGADMTAMHDVVRRLGAAEQRAGRPLEALQSAYRVGTRISWRRLGEIATAAGCSPGDVQRLAEALFLYIEELAALTVEGYAGAQAEQAGEQARRRRAAATALLADPQDPAAVAAAADDAGWPVPERLVVAVLTGDPAGRRVSRALGAEALVAGHGAGLDIVVVWPDPDGPGRMAQLLQALGTADAHVAVGVPVPAGEAHRSLRLARRCLRLGERGTLGDGPWIAAEHRAAVVLAGAESELDDLARARLAPFASLRPSSAARLQETLLAWLRAQGHRPTVARELHVHPQTVRYRMAQLRELLGEQLDDPEARFELELALRGRQLTAPPARRRDDTARPG